MSGFYASSYGRIHIQNKTIMTGPFGTILQNVVFLKWCVHMSSRFHTQIPTFIHRQLKHIHEHQTTKIITKFLPILFRIYIMTHHNHMNMVKCVYVDAKNGTNNLDTTHSNQFLACVFEGFILFYWLKNLPNSVIVIVIIV